MAQKNVALLACHADITAADRRPRIRAERFNTLRQGVKEAFVIPLMPERLRKFSRDAPEDLPEEVLFNRLHNERIDFERSRSNA